MIRTNGGFRWRTIVVAAGTLTMLASPNPATSAQPSDLTDTALIVSVDVSNSVDAENYQLQMEGIASALEDPEVIRAITGGPNAAIHFAFATWSSDTDISVPWTRIASTADARALADRIRKQPRQWTGGQATCLARMLKGLESKLIPEIHARTMRMVIDVSGDGADNCATTAAVEAARDSLVAKNVTLNGLPIVRGGHDDSDVTVAGWKINKGPQGLSGNELTMWYERHVKGGPASFILPANGFRDFARAIRQKFVMEISLRGTRDAGGNPLGYGVFVADQR